MLLVAVGLSTPVHCAIGTDTVFSTEFTQSDGALPADWTVGSEDASSTYAVISNRAEHTSGAGVYSWAKIDPALFGAANYSVKTQLLLIGGVFLRFSDSANVPTGYFLWKNGSGAQIDRVVAGVTTELVAFTYVGAWDGAPSAWIRFDVDDSGGNPVLTISSSDSENGTYTQRATYTDTDGAKITAAGTAAIATNTSYSAGLRSWDYFKVIGTAVGGSSGLLLRRRRN